MSTVNIGKEAVAGFMSGNGTVGTDAAQVYANSIEVLKHVTVHADSGNSGTIKVGASASQASTGYVLNAGDSTPPIFVNDLSLIWVVGSGSGQNFSFICS